tara:strand:- start:2701 stop:3450 length:750 start_codon:yes stop_codon:yes gene_type:complete
MIIYPNAKINIGLNILNKRIDGYHELSSIFYPVLELYDILEVIPSDDFCFSTTGISIPGNDNICINAFQLLKEDFDISNVKIHLHKMIPIGAGLGGGSSDGAFTLKLLNELFDLNISNQQLEIYALQLGADCPFFIDNTPKRIMGIGDKMTSVNLDLSTHELKFIFPNLHISTSDAFGYVNPRESENDLLDIISRPIEDWKGRVKNDFEITVFQRHPELLEMKEKLYDDGAVYASMTGSGSTLYGLFLK